MVHLAERHEKIILCHRTRRTYEEEAITNSGKIMPYFMFVYTSQQTIIIVIIINFNSIFYFNVLTQQLQEPISESAQEDKINTKNRKQKNENKTKLNTRACNQTKLNTRTCNQTKLNTRTCN
jgi:hypothetical protein